MVEPDTARNGERLVCRVGPESDPMGFVVIDSTINGRALGGLRLQPNVTEEEVAGLARTMTLKFGFLGLPQGGAKAGVSGDPEAPREERWALLRRFGRAIAPLLRSRVFTPSTDMGTENEDIRHMVASVGAPIKRREVRGENSAYYTALSVFEGAKRAACFLDGSLSGKTVAIEGFGKVGSSLAELLAGEGARIVAVSTSRGAIHNPEGMDASRLKALVASDKSRVVDLYGDAERIELPVLFELPVDILCPCARSNSIHAENAPRVRARVICPSANNPVTPEAERILFDKGALSLPEFVTNSGGVLGGTMEFASISKSMIARFIAERVGARMAHILDEAGRRKVQTREVAVSLAMQRRKEVQQRVEHPRPAGRVFSFALDLYRRGWIPGSLVAPRALRHFEKSLA